MGLDFQNLAYQGQNLDQFGPNMAIWTNLLIFEPQSSYLCQRNLIAIEKQPLGLHEKKIKNDCSENNDLFKKKKTKLVMLIQKFQKLQM